MPLYEYQCDSCGHRFEVIQKYSDAPIASCPKCGSAVRKLLSSPAIQFKGSGWYITDYARKNGGGGEASAKSEKGTTDSTSSSGDSASSSGDSTSSKSSSSGTESSGSTPPAGGSSSKS